MVNKTKIFNISLPDDLVKKVDAKAKTEYRNRSELIREAVRLYVNEVYSEGRRIHGRAEEARLAGDPQRALELIDQAITSYQKEQDVLGFTEALSAKVLTLEQLFEQTQNRNYLILARHTAESAVEIARESGKKEALAIPLDNLAKVYEGSGDLQKAIAIYQEAISNMENNPYYMHDRPALIASMKVRLALCQLRMGDKKALKIAEKEAERILEVEDPHQRDQRAWYVLALLKIAETIQRDDSQKAEEHLKAAKKMIDSDSQINFLLPKWEALSES